jgi:hypothetical protein
MPILNIFAVLLAIAVPSAAPSQQPLKTIITVISSPYCNSLADHFNGALVPMLANDRTLDGVSVQLDDLNQLFSSVNYVQQFLHVRDTLGKQQAALMESMDQIKAEIVQLRNGAALTTDPQATAQIRDAAQELQTAYDHQRQLSIDLQNMYISMLRYPISRVHPALGGFDPKEMSEPSEMRDVKSYLKFNAQRGNIAASEDKAVDVAYDAAQTYCIPKKK